MKLDHENIDGFIFDFDGTLVDSMDLWVGIDHIYLGRFGLTVPPDLGETICGMSFHEMSRYFKKRFDLPRTPEQIERDWLDLSYDQYMNSVPFKPGAREFLYKLKKKGKKIAIATSNHGGVVKDYFNKYAPDIIDGYCHAGNTSRGKPDPEVFLNAAKKLGLTPSKCIVFEDTYEGLLGAKRAGMRSVAVDDCGDKKFLKRAEELSDIIIKDYGELEI